MQHSTSPISSSEHQVKKQTIFLQNALEISKIFDALLAGETVQVDEALFENFDDLDLDDEDLDDPDWNPDD